ncbi:hypothetical protein AVEN_244190-1 [Araneus ventricosus]|uniref:Uncharacterized protein n=1 Tax=Araneus ventricosus TaxID=182803 RepID=A0A4Y2R080_ARAVE|nr:hypothetical protein AVEN_244190-1 [Araneus ventricosus]
MHYQKRRRKFVINPLLDPEEIGTTTELLRCHSPIRQRPGPRFLWRQTTVFTRATKHAKTSRVPRKRKRVVFEMFMEATLSPTFQRKMCFHRRGTPHTRYGIDAAVRPK